MWEPQDTTIRKDGWHNKYDLLFHKIAKALQLEDWEYEIRHVRGYSWTLGNIYFHTTRLYVVILGNSYSDSEENTFTYRSCNGIEDSRGGKSYTMPLKCFHNPEYVLKEFRRVMAESTYLMPV